MTPTEITLSVVHSTGLYETVRLECKYKLETDDDLSASFVKARADLDNAFFVAYPEHKPKNKLTELTVNSNEFDRVCKALKDGKTDMNDLEKYFIVSQEAINYFKTNKLI